MLEARYVTLIGRIKSDDATLAGLRRAMELYKQAANTAVKLLWYGADRFKVRSWLRSSLPLANTIVNLAIEQAEQMIRAARRSRSRRMSAPRLRRPMLRVTVYKSNVSLLSSDGSKAFVAVKLFKGERAFFTVLFRPGFFTKPAKKSKAVIREVDGKLLMDFYKASIPQRSCSSSVFLGVDLNANLRFAAIAAVGRYQAGSRSLTVTGLYNLADHIKYGVAKVPEVKLRIARVQRSGGRPSKHYARISRIKRDFAHKVSAKLVSLALQHGASHIVFENLSSLKASGPKRLRAMVGAWVRRLIQRFTEYKAYRQGIKVHYVSAQYTSAYCPFCHDKISRATIHNCSETWIRSGHGLAAVNIVKRGIANIYGIKEDDIQLLVTPPAVRGNRGHRGAPRLKGESNAR